MSAFGGIFLFGLALLLLLPAAVLLVEVLAALFRPRTDVGPGAPRGPLAVVIPAHDEAGGIADTLESIRGQLTAADRLLVVADNCSDDTAAVAAAAGAQVLVRHDAARRGKGYALDFAISHLQAEPPSMVVFVDADCRLGPGAITRLAATCVRTRRPVQAQYLMTAPAGAGPGARIAEFAWLLKNRVRPAGLRRLGLPCQLTGSGMAFLWTHFSHLRLASGNLVEDMELGVQAALAGIPPLFCEDALVHSVFPASDAGAQAQRTRWEHGHLGMILGPGLSLLRRALAGLRADLLAMALDLCVPPLALLALLTGLLLALAGVFWLATGILPPLVIAAADAVLLAVAVLAAWSRFGRDVLPGRILALAPLYALRKLPMYGRFLSSRQVEWVRSRRTHDKPPGH